MRAQHAQRQHVDLEQAQRVEVVLVPLDDAAVLHRRVFDRHQRVQLVACDHKAAGVLAQVARKADQLLRQLQPQPAQRRLGIEAVFAQALGADDVRPSNQCVVLANASMRSRSMPSARPTSRSAVRGR